jgi:hypothetical protein
MSKPQQQAKWIRLFRSLHRKVSIPLFLFFMVMAVTGFLLGLKKNTGLLPPTQTGSSLNLSAWISVDSLADLAAGYLRDSVSCDLSPELDRIDYRPEKGIAKFIYKHHYWGLQLDCTTGELLSVEKRMSDFVESLHDGSVLDDLLGTESEQFKVGYNAIMGISLFLLTASGFWLWYGPKRLRQLKRNE